MKSNAHHYRINDAHHAISYARPRGSAIVEDWICIIHPDGIRRRIVQDRIQGEETGPETGLMSYQLVRDTRVLELRTSYGMVRRKELEFDKISNVGRENLRLRTSTPSCWRYSMGLPQTKIH